MPLTSGALPGPRARSAQQAQRRLPAPARSAQRECPANRHVEPIADREWTQSRHLPDPARAPAGMAAAHGHTDPFGGWSGTIAGRTRVVDATPAGDGAT